MLGVREACEYESCSSRTAHESPCRSIPYLKSQNVALSCSDLCLLSCGRGRGGGWVCHEISFFILLKSIKGYRGNICCYPPFVYIFVSGFYLFMHVLLV